MSGIDWVMAALDTLNRTYSQSGNHSQLVLMLEGRLTADELFDLVEKKISHQPFFSGRIRRSKKHLAPYWQGLDRVFSIEDIQVFEPDVPLETVILKQAAQPFKDRHTLLAFDLLHQKDQTALLMRFDHRMFDARGAEGLLNFLLSDAGDSRISGNEPADSRTCFDVREKFPARPAGLNQWKSRFLSGQVINRFLISQYTDETTVADLVPEVLPEESEHSFSLAHFSREQTKVIEENVRKQAGYLMNGVFYLNCAAEGFDALLPQKSAEHLMVPINVDTREAKFDAKKLFFNQLSFMVYKLERDATRKDRIQSLKEQFMDQTRKKILHHFENASTLMRIAPLKKLAGFMVWRMKKQGSSFSYSYVGNQAFHLKDVRNCRVKNLFHVPIVPVNPGVGVFFTRYDQKLNMVVSGFEHTLGAESADRLRDIISERLVSES